MESKVNYTLVGIFVVALLAAMVGAVLWLSSQGQEQSYHPYRVQMTESVSGLSLDSAVKYLGVDVGTVNQIRLDPDNAQQVEILIHVRQSVPVTEHTVATLKFFGITGLAFIELSGSPQEAEPLVSKNDKPAVIQAGSSTFARVEESLNTLAIKSTVILDRLDNLLNSSNIDGFSTLLAQSNTLVAGLREDQQKLSVLLEQGIVTGQSMQQAFDKLALVTEHVDSIASDFSQKSDLVGQELDDVLQAITDASNSVGQAAQDYSALGNKTSESVEQSLHDFRQSLTQLERVMVNMKNTLQAIEDSPSDLLFKGREPKFGPGEG